MHIEYGNFLITSDKHNVILQEKTVKMDRAGKGAEPTGEYGWGKQTFHKNLEAALRAMADLTEKNSDKETFAGVIEELKQLRDEIAAAARAEAAPITSRKAGEVFLEFMLNIYSDEQGRHFTAEQVKQAALHMNDDPDFHEPLIEWFTDHLDTLGENYGL